MVLPVGFEPTVKLGLSQPPIPVRLQEQWRKVVESNHIPTRGTNRLAGGPRSFLDCFPVVSPYSIQLRLHAPSFRPRVQSDARFFETSTFPSLNGITLSFPNAPGKRGYFWRKEDESNASPLRMPRFSRPLPSHPGFTFQRGRFSVKLPELCSDQDSNLDSSPSFGLGGRTRTCTYPLPRRGLYVKIHLDGCPVLTLLGDIGWYF